MQADLSETESEYESDGDVLSEEDEQQPSKKAHVSKLPARKRQLMDFNAEMLQMILSFLHLSMLFRACPTCDLLDKLCCRVIRRTTVLTPRVIHPGLERNPDRQIWWLSALKGRLRRLNVIANWSIGQYDILAHVWFNQYSLTTLILHKFDLTRGVHTAAAYLLHQIGTHCKKLQRLLITGRIPFRNMHLRFFNDMPCLRELKLSDNFQCLRSLDRCAILHGISDFLNTNPALTSLRLDYPTNFHNNMVFMKPLVLKNLQNMTLYFGSPQPVDYLALFQLLGGRYSKLKELHFPFDRVSPAAIVTLRHLKSLEVFSLELQDLEYQGLAQLLKRNDWFNLKHVVSFNGYGPSEVVLDSAKPCMFLRDYPRA